MAVKEKDQDNKLVLEIDNGDLAKFKEAQKKWHFKDSQSLMRFAISLLVLNENNSFSIKVDGKQTDIAPAEHLINFSGNS